MTNERNARQLSGLDDWQLEDDDQDLRGRMLKGRDGADIGMVDDMLADTDEQRIVALRLQDGRLVNIDAVDVDEDHCPILIGGPGNIGARPDNTDRDQMTTENVPIVEERLDIGKKRVDLGRVRISTRVVSETVGENVMLREERVNVERRDLNEPIGSDAADKLFKDDTIELTETGERVVASKDAFVTGEVEVSKDVDTRTERVEGEVRRTEVDVDREKSTDRPKRR